MRILYLQSEPGPSTSGVVQKVIRTVDCWRRLGIEADIVGLDPVRIVPAGGDIEPYQHSGSRVSWLRRMNQIGKQLGRFIQEESPDLVYSRELIWSPSLESTVARSPWVFEINGDSGQQIASRSTAGGVFWRLTSPRLLRRCRGIVSVTEELSRRYQGLGPQLGVFGNSVDVPDMLPRKQTSGRPIALMLVGEARDKTIRPNRGLDRLEDLARHLPEVRFIVCGGKPPESLQESRRIEFLQARSGDSLQELLSSATVAVGSLAPHRTGLTESSSLKVRTMLAAGLPLIFAHPDAALEATDRFTLRLDLREGVAKEDIGRVARFIEAARDPAVGDAAWAFARMNLDRTIVERARLDFLRGLAS